MFQRNSGILLPISSLPSRYGIGDLGPSAFRFADRLHDAGQRYWQILPLNPTSLSDDNSPYMSVSAFAYNPLLISIDFMIRDGHLSTEDIEPLPRFPHQKVNYEKVTRYKTRLFSRAFERFSKQTDKTSYNRFCSENADWLDDFALFLALKRKWKNQPWNEWPKPVRDRRPESIDALKDELRDSIEKTRFLQFVFHEQWEDLKAYCKSKDIHIIGDLPIYVTYDSVDCWTHADIFKLDSEKRPLSVSGVPPDYFSETGQLWNNPVYKWDVLQKRDFDWWIQRIRHNISLFDMVRIDHFRGLVAYWEVPAGEKTAIHGKWIKAPAVDFLKKVADTLPDLPIIAEDLGIITADVVEVMEAFNLPGMRVLQFAFGDNFPFSPYLPHAAVERCLYYTGTHDNNTLKGWFYKDATAEEKERLFRYIGKRPPYRALHWELIRLAMMSPAGIVIVPMQDILELGIRARMNRPGYYVNNWRWRMAERHLAERYMERFKEMTHLYRNKNWADNMKKNIASYD